MNEQYEHRPMNVEEVAEYLRVSENTVMALLKNGELPARKIGREWRVSWKNLQDFVDGITNAKAKDAE